MRRKIRTTLVSAFILIVLFSCYSLYNSRLVISGKDLLSSPATLENRSGSLQKLNYAIREELQNHSRQNSYLGDSLLPDSVLLPDWEVLLVIPSEIPLLSDSRNGYHCLFRNNATSPANPAGILPFSNLTTFKCIVPHSVRRRRPLFRPILTKSPGIWREEDSEPIEMFRWSFLAYEALSTENDVVLFVKGVNHRQGVNRSPTELRCVFGNDLDTGVKTAVTSSSQEVFRCVHPNDTALRRLFSLEDERVKVSLEIRDAKNNVVAVPSVAYYTPRRSLDKNKGRYLLCASTMVFNVAKFLKEWVMYHSKIGVEKFILYDNGSDDGLEEVVEELLLQGYIVETFLWPWTKTQEAGFSHGAMYAMGSCKWMMYTDVDEFVFSPSWVNSSHPSHHMLTSLLPRPSSSSSSSSRPVGQVSFRCFEFGPSNQRSNPIEGVTQGYTCRRLVEQRHKSVVLLEAIDESLLNVVHHFQLKEGYRGKRLSKEEGLVNHYKYQAWPEFKAKFRRRVSAYVVDWREEVNPSSKDRTPGLGFSPVEPKGWANKFCEVNDTMLKKVTRRWFGFDSPEGYIMGWQHE